MSRSASSRSRSGIVSVEFALVGAALFLGLVTVMDVGRYVAASTAMRSATAEVVRAAVMDQTGPACTNPRGYALDRTAFLDPAVLTVNAVCGATSVSVTTEYGFTFIVPFFGTAPRTLRAVVTSPV